MKKQESFIEKCANDLEKLPKFKTQDEEIKFWEKHSIADYWDELEEGKDIFKKPKLTRSH
jgi:hypothetical protein